MTPSDIDFRDFRSLRKVRFHLDLTQEQFAHELGVTVSTVNRWENGHCIPSPIARQAILRLLHLHESTGKQETTSNVLP